MHLLDLFGIRRAAPELPAHPMHDPFNPNQVTESVGRGAPASMAELEWTGNDYDRVAMRPSPPRANRTWRLPIPVASDDQAAGGAQATVTLSDQHQTTATARLARGEADTRRGEADHAAGPRPDLAPSPEAITMARPWVRLTPEAPPERMRQGFTGADPTRAAQHPIAYTIRPFDKGIADHPGAIVKATQDNPTAARPPDRGRLLGGRPSPAGSADSHMLPVGSAGPNTVRQVPTAWDARLVTNGVQQPHTSSTSRRFGLR